MLRVCAALVALGAYAAAEAPVGKVVTLLEDLKAKIEADGTAEQKVYDKFACWCEKTTSKKAKSIVAAKKSIEELSEKVLNLKGTNARLGANIAQLKKDIASNQDSQKSATGLREKEQKEYDGARTNLEQAIGALEHAIKVLEGAGESASALQQAELVSTAGSLSTALEKAPRGASYATEADKKLISDFVTNPEHFWSHARAKGVSALQMKNPFGDYSPGSGAIQGILKGMYDAMVQDLESKDAAEGTSQKNYEELISTKTAELEELNTNLVNKEETLGKDTKELADAVLERDETTVQLKDDEDFFLESKETCESKAANWAERTRLRTEEKAGVLKALDILTSDEAKETFGKSMSMLMQTDQDGVLAKRRRDQAFDDLAKVARKHHSLKLASIASLIQTNTKGFEVVTSEIDKMLAQLRQEEMDDITLRDYCQAEEVKVETEMEDLDHKMDDLTAEMGRQEALAQELSADIKTTEDDIKATQDAMAEMLAARMADSEDFKAALKDDLDAAGLLQSAIEAMTEFYNSNKLPLGLAQTGKAKAKKDREPEYDDSGAPPDTFSEPYGGRSTQGGGIVSILGYLKEDVENDILQAKQAEAKAQEQFENQRDASTAVLQSAQAKLTTLEEQKANADQAHSEAEVRKEGAGKMKESKGDYREVLKPKCDWMKETFQERREKRQDEMDGMMHAKAALAGGGQALIQTDSFLAKRT